MKIKVETDHNGYCSRECPFTNRKPGEGIPIMVGGGMCVYMCEHFGGYHRDLEENQIYVECENPNQTKIVMTDNQKYVAKTAILNALLEGRHLSQMDCREFMIEDMRTPISHLKEKFPDTHILRTEWIVTPVRKARIKSYWLERKQDNN